MQSEDLRKTEKPLEVEKPLMEDMLKHLMFLEAEINVKADLEEQSDNWFNAQAIANMQAIDVEVCAIVEVVVMDGDASEADINWDS